MIHLRHLLTATLLSFLAFAKAQEVTFSTPGGFYDNPFELTLSCDHQDKVIHYTTNGNTPTADDPVYHEPLLLNERLYSSSDIYTIRNCPEEYWFQPESVQKCIVIRAAAFDQTGICLGKIATQSYFIKSLGCDTHGLPVVSLCVDSLDLFDYETGIFVPGIHFDPMNPEWTGNYYEKGREWERPMNIEFYELDNTGINQKAGVRTHGGNGRRHQQKCVKIYAREEYGKKRFKHKFFESIPNSSFKHLVLKPFYASWNQSGVNDHICNQIASQLNLEALASRPIVMYLNGEYWGIYYIHERPDERYLEDHYDADLATINLIGGWDYHHLKYGTSETYEELVNWIKDHDLAEDENYQYVSSLLDINNFIDYIVFETFIANRDWPANNALCWQADYDLWRWIFYDGDACLISPISGFDVFDNATYEGDELWPSNKGATLFFRKLIKNDTFKTLFVSRYYQLLGTTFCYKATKLFYDEIYAQITDEIANQSDRFGNPESRELWKKNMDRIDSFLSHRASEMDNAICDYYAASNTGLEIVDAFYNNTTHLIHVEIKAEETVKAILQVYDMMGRQYVSNMQILGKGKTQIDFTFESNPGIYIFISGGIAKKFIVIN